jgi:hypothetical protein
MHIGDKHLPSGDGGATRKPDMGLQEDGHHPVLAMDNTCKETQPLLL